MNQDAFFEYISAQYTNDLPFVAYRKPNKTTVKAMLQNDDALHIALDFSVSGFVFAPFDDRQSVIIIPNDVSEIIETVIPAKAETQNEVSFSNDEIPAFAGMTEHINLVQKGIDTIKATDIKKVVLSRKELVPLSEKNPINIFKQLLNSYASAFVYCWYHPSIGLWLGATPETLLKVQGNRFNTMSLAGTQPYNGTLNVEWQNKEIEEQQIVTDSIVNSIKPFVNTVKISDTETIQAGSLLHLKTSISGIVNTQSSNLKQLLNSLHPTPAICGFPQGMAKQFVFENEGYNREFYTGFLGELNVKHKVNRNTNRRNVENNAYTTVRNTSEIFVNLRCMKLENDKAEVFVGGGITKDSVAELEWQETVNKTKTIKKVL